MRPGCPHRARYEVRDNGGPWQQVCRLHFFEWNGTLPIPATLAQVRS